MSEQNGTKGARGGAATRRDFMRWTCGGAAAAATFHTLGSAGVLRAASNGSADYRALVVLYLAGGNDSFNMVVPTNAGPYDDYAAARQNLAVPEADLLGISPATSDGNTYGLHPSLAPLEPLFTSGRLGFVLNAGNLVRPVSRAEYQSGAASLPPRLFSHNDQQAQSMRIAADRTSSIGWGGALSDELVARNGGASLSPSITLGGSTPLLTGTATQAYHLGTSGSVALRGFNGSTGSALQASFDLLAGQAQAHPLQQQFAITRGEAIELDALISGALDGQAPLQTTFPEGSKAGAQLAMIARMIGVHGTLGMERQVFFAKAGGWDTHAAQLEDHPVLLSDLAASIAAFQAALVELGCENEVTLAVISEFGRTLTSNGQGTDHGWGGHFLACGGAVAGGDLYGTMPSLVVEGPDDSGRGRMIPTTATDQFAATLAEWFGVPTAQLGTVFPNLSNFASPTLGFMT